MNQVSFLILFNRFDVSSRTVFPLPACDRTSQGDRLSGETDGAIHVHVRATRAYVRVCGGGRALARILLPPNLTPSLSLSISLLPSIPLFLFLPFFSPSASLSLSLAPSLFPRPRQRVTLLLFRRYLDWLAFQRTTLFPATAEIPGRSFIAAQLYRPRENFTFPTNGYEHASRVFRKLGFHESPAGQLAVRRVLRRNRFAGMRSGSGDGGGR